jgi:hypothetical protein
MPTTAMFTLSFGEFAQVGWMSGIEIAAPVDATVRPLMKVRLSILLIILIFAKFS